jgi:hypothetical protein
MQREIERERERERERKRMIVSIIELHVRKYGFFLLTACVPVLLT